MDYHSDIHRQLVKERQQESAKERKEYLREMDRDREEFLANTNPRDPNSMPALGR